MLLDRVKEIIQESKACRDDMRMRQQAFQESLKYLGSLKEEAHWFCAQEPLNALVQESLQLFGFSGSDALSWLKGRMKRQLSACYLCVRGYQMLKREAAKAYEGNEEFMRGLREFDYERLSEAISEAILGVEGEGGVIKMWMRMMVYECLWETGLLLETDLFEKFKWFFLRIQRDGKFLRIDDEVVPGMIVFLFEEKCQELSVWAEKSLEKLSRKLTLSEFAWVAKMPFTVAMDRYLKSTGGHTPWLSAVPVSTFWKGSSVLFRYIEKESIIIELSSQGWDIVGLTCSRLSSENTPVVLDVLNTFSELLNVLGSTFWEQAMYCSPFNAIDAIFQNDYIRKMIKTFSEINEPSSVLFTQPFTWIKPFISSLQNSNKHHLCSKFLFYLLEYFQNDEYPKESKDYCKIAAYQALSFAFEGLLESDSLDFGTYLILLEENRKVFENYLKIIVEESLFSTQTNDCVKKQACLLVGLVLNMDCRILQQEFCNIKKNQEPDNSIITIKNYGCGKIWDILIQNTQKCDLNLISQIFQSFSLLSYIEIIHTEFERSIHFNKIAMDMILKMTRLLSVIDEVNYNIFKIMLQVPEINYSVILLIFSPVLEISQLSFNIVKHAYNCIDYYEAFRFSLSHNFVSTLIGLINVIDNFIDIQSFTIASQLIKISVIVLDVLCSSENGLLLLDEYKSDENQSVLILLWSRFWILLNMLFSFSLSWANEFSKDSMIVFLKNILEMATNMVNYSKIHDSIILLNGTNGLKKNSDESRELSFQVQDCLKCSFLWLRLNDDALLISTVDFICFLFFRLKSANIIIEESVLTSLKNFLRKKSHKTNLSNEQKIRLYSVLQESEFVMNKSNKAEIDSLSIIKSKTKDTETLTNNSAKKLSNSCYVEPYKLKGVSSDSVLQTKPTIQQKLVIESFYSKTMLPLESKNNINKCSSKDLTFLKNKYINHCGSGSKSSSIKQFRLELLRDKKKIDKIVRKPVKAGVDSMDSKLFGPEIHESDDSVKNKNLEQSVSSDSDSENNNIHSTFLLKDDKIYPKIRQVERKSVQKLDCVDVIDKGLFSKQKLQKQKADVLKMKLFPVLSPLHKQILQWDINYNGEIPPGSNEQMYLEVEYTFQTSQAYVNTFEPLLLLECWQQIIKAKEENVDQSFKIKIINRTSVDEFIDLYVFVSYEIFYSVVISDSDILVISNSLKPLVDTNVISCLAKVQMVSKKKDSIEITLRTYPSNKMNTLLRPNNELYGLKLFSLVTIQREYSALKSLEYLELCNDIINAKSQPFPSISFNEVQRAMVAYDVNKPQAEAIIGVTKSTGFYLIQGPPGTGKTKTILGMINAFLSESKNKSARFGTIQNDCESSRILVCAPSNAAIDEIVLRLKQGFQDAKGIRYYPKIVRVGSNVAINLNVKDVSLDNLVEMELSKSNVKIEHDHQIANQEVLREQLNSILKQRDSLRKQLEDEMLEQKKKNLEVELKSLNLQKNNLGQQLDELRDQQSSVNKSLDIARHKIQIDILTNADIICSTLSASGYELFGNLAFDFSTVIIDEAAQCIELSTIIPLKYGCKRCILVGDPNQLPPTVFSQTAASYSYEQSLFVRMQKNCPSSVHMLSIQYRMHPSISQFPSKFFYSNRLVNGDDMEKKTKRPWHQIDLFGPYRFFDIHGYEDEAFCSPFNLMEARAALLIYDTIIQNFPSTNFNGYFGIITPYKQQLGKIKELFVGKYGESILKNIDFNTVDGFQGQEKDIIILSCVRSSVKGIGFLSDIRRMNVGLTRAKSSLIILGNVKTLSCHSYWRSLIEDAQRRNLLTKFDDVLFKALKKNNDAYFHNSNITHDEKISDKSYPLQKNTEEDSYLKKGDFSQDLKVFENKKNEISSNFETSMETSSQVPFVIHKKRLAPDIFIRRPKIKK